MSRLPIETNEHQLALPNYVETVPAGSYEGIDPEQRISLIKLLGVVGTSLAFGKELVATDYGNAEISVVNNGLFIHPTDPRFYRAQQILTLGVQGNNNGTTSRNFGIVFPATEYRQTALNARLLGRHSVNRTRLARLPASIDRDNDTEAAMRSAGHTLHAKLESLDKLLEKPASERNTYLALYRNLRQPHRTRQYAKNIDRQRALADEKIHEAVETAVINQEIGHKATSSVHRVVRKKLYNGNYSSAELTYNWLRYIVMVGRWTAARGIKVELARTATEHELTYYQPYLDRQVKREERAAQAA